MAFYFFKCDDKFMLFIQFVVVRFDNFRFVFQRRIVRQKPLNGMKVTSAIYARISRMGRTNKTLTCKIEWNAYRVIKKLISVSVS